MEQKFYNMLFRPVIGLIWLIAMTGTPLISSGAEASKRFCGPVVAPLQQPVAPGALDHAGELKGQLDENRAAVAELRNSDLVEYNNRIRYMNLIKKSGVVIDGKPLRLVRVGFKNLSFLNSDLVTLSHAERFLEMYYREFHKLLKDHPDMGGIVLQRYIEFYVITTVPQAEIEKMKAMINEKVVTYFESSRSEDNVRSELHLPDFTWKEMVEQITWIEPLEISPLQYGLQNPQVRQMDPEHLFKNIITDGHIESTFKLANRRQSSRHFKHYGSFEEWSLDAKKRANHLKRSIETAGGDWKVALKKLHELAGDPSSSIAFQRWLKSIVGPDHRALFEEFEAHIFDWQMTNFFQFSDNPVRARRKVSDPDVLWSSLETLPENSLERRRVLLEKTKLGEYIIATDFKGLGLFKRMEQDRWLQEGLRKEDVPYIFNRLNRKMHDHFNGLYNEIKAKVGPKKGVYIYVSGDDAFIVLPKISKRMVGEIELIIANRPMRIDDIIPGSDPIKVYSSGAVRIDTVGDHKAIAKALAYVRDYLFKLKKRLKEEERQSALAIMPLQMPKI